ncbi:hypothetical protein [Nocardia sp. NPDC052112]|uniref:hypothetical protein n=1 Tax=Nocardia sp. NPDC052112 TaxID=3155646 RepID=UPI003412F5F0
MTETGEVTIAATIRWLHDEGLVRLAGVGGRVPNPIAAYTIDVATGSVGAHPATGVGVGSDVITLAADDLPYPSGTPKRLVVVGVTSAESVLVVDLAITHAIAINADRPETAARAWATQLLLNPEISISTNSSDIAIATSTRCRHQFIPGGSATVLNIDDQHPPITTVTLNPTVEGPDHLDIAPDGTGEMYLGARFWQLRQVLSIEDAVWTALSARLEDPDD